MKTTPKDWEEPSVDLREFITSVNQLKSAYPVFQEDGPTTVLNYDNQSILLLWKATKDGEQEALIILNKDNWHHQYFYSKNVCDYVQQKTGLIDVSPEYKLEFLPAPFEYDLRPGQVIVLLSQS